jgi:protein-tyrosine phosphatase
MKCNVYWIPNDESSRLGIMPRPRGADWLEDEIHSLQQQGVDVLVSLLTPEETAELHLDDEPVLCRSAGVQFLSFPIPDRSIPESSESALQFLTELNSLHQAGKKIVIHCRAGIGRASLIAASVLALNGHTVENAFSTIATARGCPVPDTAEQSIWLAELFQNYNR